MHDAWSRFKDRLHAFALRRVRSASDADDIVQDVLVRLLQHRDRIESDRLAAWLFATARNAIIDGRRKSGRDSAGAVPCPATVAGAGDDPGPASHELAACVQPLLAMLSAADRDVLERVELREQSQAELAATLDVPTSTVKSRVQRARRRLREHFERCCEIELDGRGGPHEFTSRGGPEYPRCDGCAARPTDKPAKED